MANGNGNGRATLALQVASLVGPLLISAVLAVVGERWRKEMAPMHDAYIALGKSVEHLEHELAEHEDEPAHGEVLQLISRQTAILEAHEKRLDKMEMAE